MYVSQDPYESVVHLHGASASTLLIYFERVASRVDDGSHCVASLALLAAEVEKFETFQVPM